MPRALPKLQRVAAYALIIRDEQILLTRLASRISADGKWHLPGGGLDHGENPRDALVREIREETGLDADVGDSAHVYSAHLPVDVAPGPAVGLPGAPHRVRRVGAARRARRRGWRRSTAPPWPWPGTRSPTCSPGSCRSPTSSPRRWPTTARSGMQRIGVYALIRRDDAVLLTRISQRGFHSGSWTLPGGGLDHGESPREGLAREVREECGVACEVGDLLDVHDLHFGGVAPSGRFEDFHGVHLLFRATVAADAEPRRRRGRRHHRRGRLGAPRRDRRRRPAGARRGPRRPRRRPALTPSRLGV